MELFFLLFLALFVVAALPAVVAARICATLQPTTRYRLVLATFTTLVAPSWIDVVIFGSVSVPVPFGFVVLFAIIVLGEIGFIRDTLLLWPVWHLICFPLTAAVGALVFRRLNPNRLSQPTPQGGTAEFER